MKNDINENKALSQTSVSKSVVYVSTLEDEIRFGKYKGRKIKNIIDIDVQYIEFIIKKIGFKLTDNAYQYFCDKINFPDDDFMGNEDFNRYYGDEVETVC